MAEKGGDKVSERCGRGPCLITNGSFVLGENARFFGGGFGAWLACSCFR